MTALHDPLFPPRFKAVIASLTGLLLALFLLSPPLLHCADPLQKKLHSSRSRVQKNKKTIASLSRTERELFKDLARIEDKLKGLAGRLQQQEQEAQRIQDQVAQARADLKQTTTQQAEMTEHLGDLLCQAWPAILSARSAAGAHLDSWGDASRRGAWIRAMYAQADKNLTELRQKRDETGNQLASLEKLQKTARLRLSEAEQSREQLLDKRLGFLKKVQSVRSRKLKKEEELHRVMGVIEELQSKIKAQKSRQIKDLKGTLPWPVDGKLIAGYKPRKDPPRRGIGLAVPGDPTVRAVSWGKVVHNDQLRGFGRVIILAHGDNYYTLYAFLADTSVRSGQKVEKGEQLGRAGFYPLAKGTGLYFELRFGQKAINPETWLSAR